MYRMIALIPGSNVAMLRVCCDACTNRVSHNKVDAAGRPVAPIFRRIQGAGARKCDVHGR